MKDPMLWITGIGSEINSLTSTCHVCCIWRCGYEESGYLVEGGRDGDCSSV